MRNDEFEFESIARICGGLTLGTTVGIIVRHKESGLEVKCSTERSQHRNRQKGIAIIQEILTLWEFESEIRTKKIFGLGDLHALQVLKEEFAKKYLEELDENNLWSLFGSAKPRGEEK